MDLIFEIITEELPPSYVRPALEQIEVLMRTMLEERRIGFNKVKALGSPRRLVVFVWGLSESQNETSEKIFGPSVSVAFDSNGNPTKAAIGFANSAGVDLSDLRVGQKGRGKYVYVEKRLKGRSTREELPALIVSMVKSISFPKSMRWESTGMRFARPIRRIVVVLDGEKIDFEMAEVRSSSKSLGHRFIARSEIEVKSINQYIDSLKKHFVIVDHEERKKLISERIAEAAASVGGTVVEDEELLERVTFMVEFPLAVLGEFSPSFLAMPRDVITTALKEHQDFFSVQDENSKLLPYFIAVADRASDPQGKIRRGNQRVLKARLEDAHFYWEQDLKDGLESMVSRLDQVIWQEQLGTLKEKTERLISLCRWLVDKTGICKIETVSRAAYLCKADLTSNMVREKEFSSLQGRMGMEYAIAGGEPHEVSLAIYEHYLPRFAEDSLPSTPEGTLLSIADRIDTLVGYFGLDLIPSGSEDPYALRRCATGLARIFLEKKIDVSLSALIEKAAGLFDGKLVLDLENLRSKLVDFIGQRLYQILIDRGYKQDLVSCVISSGFDEIGGFAIRIRAISEFIERPESKQLIVAFKRPYNIAAGWQSRQVDESRFEREEESELWAALKDVEAKVERLIGKKEFRSALLNLTQLTAPINRFFENVMVMVDDEAVRGNRLGLMRRIADLFLKLGDFSKLELE